MRELSLNRFNLQKLITGIGQLSLGFLLLSVVTQFTIVLARHVFGLNFLWAQEVVGYLHTVTIMLAFAWTLSVNRHVRIDVLSERWTPLWRRRIYLIGRVVFMVPGALAIIWTSLAYVENSWAILEGSQEVSGLPGLFLVKSLLLYAGISLLLVGAFSVNEKSGK